MCGIVVHLDLDGGNIDRSALLAGCDAIVHRGPDDKGHYIGRGIGLAMRRLSIIDVAGGHQPIANEDGSVITVLNGELYGYREVRVELERAGHVFRTHSDTEVLVHGYEEWGLDLLSHIRGMYAFALWDIGRKRLFAARDRLGEKPLFYTLSGRQLYLASEVKALPPHAYSLTDAEPRAVDEFLAHGYVRAPRSFFRGVSKLPPAHFLIAERGELKTSRYWSPHPTSSAPVRSVDEATEFIEPIVREAVREQMVSDVPLGALLSGGVDSTAVVSFMQELGSGGTHTFCAGFTSAEHDERAEASETARQLGTIHREIVIEPPSQQDIEALFRHMDEPFADKSIIPTFEVCRFARQFVTVALTGDGGDEIFGGYRSYLAALDAPSRMPAPALAVIRAMLGTSPSLRPELDRFRRRAARGVERFLWSSHVFEPAQRARLYRPEFARNLRPDWLGFKEQRHLIGFQPDDISAMQIHDVLTYLPDDVLVKVDRASMRTSLETRAPLLDARVVSAGLSLPPHLKIAAGQGKRTFRRLVEKRVGARAAQRPKRGFAIPRDEWLVGSLRDNARDTILDVLPRQPYFSPRVLHDFVDRHLGSSAHAGQLFTLYALAVFLGRAA